MPALQRLAAQALGEYDRTALHTVRRLMSQAGARTLVAERHDAVVGFVVVEPEGRGVLSISAIAVDVAHRGRGVGEGLMAAAERHARARSATRLTLTTAQANVAALSLFFRAGFVIRARNLTRYTGGQPACELVKQLT